MAQSRSARRAAQRRKALQPSGPGPGRWIGIGVGVAIVVVGVVLYLVFGRGGSGTSAAPSSASDLAAAPDYSGHPIIDNIPCGATEEVRFHIHAHIAVYVNGQAKTVPYGIGIAAPRQLQNTPDGPFVASGSCFYWLHTHDATGIVHEEAPNPENFTLGQFFDVWQQPLTASQAGPAQGQVYAYVNGQPFSGDPRTIPLQAHAVIQLDVGQNAPPPQPFTFPQGL